MEDLLTYFQSLTSIKGTSIQKIKEGITNDNYKINTTSQDCFVLRIPKKNQIGLNRNQEMRIIELLKNYNIDVPCLYFNPNTGVKITKYIQHKKIHSFFNDNQLKQFIFELKKLHSISEESLQHIQDFDVFRTLETYKEEVQETLFLQEKQMIENVKKLYTKYPKVLCHNDLLYANILCCKKKIFLIDYEYAGKNIALFDLASFISENNIEDLKDQTIFLKEYFGTITVDLLKEFETMLLFEDLLWGYWAKMMNQKYQKKVYLTIYQKKSERYHARIRNF